MEIEKKHDFRASDGWLHKFKKRFDIRFLKLSGVKTSTNQSEIAEFTSQLEKKTEDARLTPDKMYNAGGLELATVANQLTQEETTSFASTADKSYSLTHLCAERSC